MHYIIGNCWRGIFLDAYRYSTNYLVFTVTLIVASLLCLMIYEKPQFYKFIFKRSKHSILSARPSDATVDDNEIQSMLSISNASIQKFEMSKEELAYNLETSK